MHFQGTGLQGALGAMSRGVKDCEIWHKVPRIDKPLTADFVGQYLIAPHA